MLLRNLYFNKELLNDTRLIITRLHRDCIKDKILNER